MEKLKCIYANLKHLQLWHHICAIYSIMKKTAAYRKIRINLYLFKIYSLQTNLKCLPIKYFQFIV